MPTAAQNCLQDLWAAAGNNGSVGCTANDVGVSDISIVDVRGACLCPDDTFEVDIAVDVVSTANARYDIGVYFSLDGDPNGDGAETGFCQQETLAFGTPPAGGPDLDGDVCPDIPQSALVQGGIYTLTAQCLDAGNDGFADIGACTAWKNQSNSNDCSAPSEAIPGTTSKCKCAVFPGVPAPEIQLDKTCVQVGPRTVLCGITYQNAAAGGADPEAGAGDFITFVDDYDDAQGWVEDLAPSAGDTAADRGTDILWVPTGAETDNNVPAGASGTLGYTYRINPDVPDGTVITNTVCAYENGRGGLDLNGEATCCATATFTVGDLTAAWISDFATHRASEGVEVSWSTTAEAGTVSLELQRLVGRKWESVSDPLPARWAPEGSRYSVVDLRAPRARSAQYRLVERDIWGGMRFHGPYRSDPKPNRFERLERPAPGAVRSLPPSPVLADRRLGVASRGVEPLPPRQSTGAPDRVNVTTLGEGWIAVPVPDLAAAWQRPDGHVLGAAHRDLLRLTHHGEDVAWELSPDGRSLVFYAESNATPFSAESVYVMSDGPGTRMGALRGPSLGEPAHQVEGWIDFERDEFAAPVLPDSPDADYWYWSGVNETHPTAFFTTFEVELPHVVPATAGSISLRLRGATLAGHGLAASLNGIDIGTASWFGFLRHEASFAVPAGVLIEGINTLRVEGQSLPGSVWFVDGFRTEFTRHAEAVDGRLDLRVDEAGTVEVGGLLDATVWLADITDPALPVLLPVDVAFDASAWRARFAALPGRTYSVTSLPSMALPARLEGRVASRLDSAQRGDYLVIAPRRLLEGAEELAAYRAVSGWTPFVAELQSIYDLFSHGEARPDALRDFIATALAQWDLPPTHVALVGAGSFDHRDLMGHGKNLLPAAMVETPHGLFASDFWYADASGDGRPEIAVGRLPVFDSHELHEYVARLRATEQGSPETDLLMVADDTDQAGDFAATGEALIASAPDGAAVHRAYLEGHPPAEVRTAVVDAFNAGVSVVAYAGHGGVSQWADEGLLRGEDVATLANADRLPVVTSLSCSIGRFDVPGFSSLAEDLVTWRGGGAAAVFAASGMTVHADNDALGRNFFEAWSAGAATAGEAALTALRAANTSTEDVYTLLGDPAARLP
jgi:hypothetical protein